MGTRIIVLMTVGRYPALAGGREPMFADNPGESGSQGLLGSEDHLVGHSWRTGANNSLMNAAKRWKA